jgi:hypothetical protein
MDQPSHPFSNSESKQDAESEKDDGLKESFHQEWIFRTRIAAITAHNGNVELRSFS